MLVLPNHDPPSRPDGRRGLHWPLSAKCSPPDSYLRQDDRVVPTYRWYGGYSVRSSSRPEWRAGPRGEWQLELMSWSKSTSDSKPTWPRVSPFAFDGLIGFDDLIYTWIDCIIWKSLAGRIFWNTGRERGGGLRQVVSKVVNLQNEGAQRRRCKLKRRQHHQCWRTTDKTREMMERRERRETRETRETVKTITSYRRRRGRRVVQEAFQ